MAKTLHYEQESFFAYIGNIKKKVTKVFCCDEEGIPSNEKDMRKDILDTKDDVCVEIPNFILFWTMKYFSFQSWIAMCKIFCNKFFIFFYSRGAWEVFNFTNGGSMGMAYLEKNEFKLGRKLI